MKPTRSILMIMFACLSSIGFSQIHKPIIYLKVYGAYSFLSPGSFKVNTSKKPLSLDPSIFKVDRKGMGEGFRFGAGIGITLKEYLSVGVDGEYLAGGTLKNSISQPFASSATVNIVTTVDYAILSIIPNVTIRAVSNPKFIIYNRVGVIVGIPIKMDENYDYKFVEVTRSNRQQVITTTYHAEYELKTGMGFQISIGMQKKITDRLSGYVEISGSSLSLDRVSYEEIGKSRIEKITNVSTGELLYESTDNSRNIIEYKNEGSTRLVKQTTGNDVVYTYTYAQDPVNINAISIGFGITLRF